MKLRRFGRTGWNVSEIGYGMWGMGAAWSGSDDAESLSSLQLAVERGCNFFDTAWAYGSGHSEGLLGQTLRTNYGRKLYVATKIPPKNSKWPARREYSLDDCYPPDHIETYVRRSRANLGVRTIDLIQFHTWEDSWTDDGRWIRAMEKLKRDGVIRAVGISLNRWESWNGIRAVRSGLVDAVQVVYNIFDQTAEDELFPACREQDVAVIARVPFDVLVAPASCRPLCESKKKSRRLFQRALDQVQAALRLLPQAFFFLAALFAERVQLVGHGQRRQHRDLHRIHGLRRVGHGAHLCVHVFGEQLRLGELMFAETRSVGRQNSGGHVQGHPSKGQESDLSNPTSCLSRKHHLALPVDLSKPKLCRGCQQGQDSPFGLKECPDVKKGAGASPLH